jgi:hypothetical protein
MSLLRMLSAWLLFVPLLLAADSPPVRQPQRPADKEYQIPYRLTLAKHIVVRVKINRKGPFNFILDTGAPALFVATKIANRVGVTPDANGWAKLDRFEIEGGLVIPQTHARIETPFQLEGMNGMGLAGVEIHGLIGYQLLAKYRMEIDFTRDKMTWVELSYKPSQPLGMGLKSGGQGGLEVLGVVMKGLGGLLGRRSSPEIVVRGFLGMTLDDGDEFPKVHSVLAQGPAGKAGLRPGDVVQRLNDRTVTSVADVLNLARRIPPGGEVRLTIQRGKEITTIRFTAEEGI